MDAVIGLFFLFLGICIFSFFSWLVWSMVYDPVHTMPWVFLFIVASLAGFYIYRKTKQPIITEQPVAPPPLPVTTISYQHVDTLLAEVLKDYSPLMEPYVEVMRKVVRTWPPTSELVREVKEHLASNLRAIGWFFREVHTHPSPFHGPPSANYTSLSHCVFELFNIPIPRPLQIPPKLTEYLNNPEFRFRVTTVEPPEYGPLYHEAWQAVQICLQPNPIPYPDNVRVRHTQIVGGSGAGKTTLLSHLFLYDLKQADPPSLILIDPKRVAIDRLSKLALFNNELKDRLIIIRPEYRPALNIFDTSEGTTGIVDSVTYLCSMLGTDMTGKQQGLYRNLANLLLVFPETLKRNATLLDLYNLMVPKFPAEYEPAVKALRPIQQNFFTNKDFESGEYRDTKAQIRTRLNALLASEDLDSLFTSQTSAIHIGRELQKGSIILIDCGEGSATSQGDVTAFGFIFIAEVMRAVMQRNALEPEKRRQAYLYIDEFATFMGGDMSYFFTAARQCNVGGIFSYHDLSKCTKELESSLFANTATKIIARNVTASDARAFAPYLRWEWEAIRNQEEYHFALSIDGVRDRAVSITAPKDPFDGMLFMNDEAYAELLKRNRERVSGPAQQKPPPPEPEAVGIPTPAGPKPEWTQQDELNLADCLHQQAVALRRGDKARADELEERIQELKARKAAAQEEEEYEL